ncbi:aminoglycoside phosphotransferase family protein [Actinokineospora sp. NBRC 105648]|uniref:phosphotransferase family protein n=1 Tax=Actinokineospora sp. NBRC 105648 TaxID=3032206 RepID=UPI0024A15C23|nr:aminoglycoside phosphotransferase family protein [Actinokineospora sp. NBRC 105648]GLZ40623.1 hypothetical protein Acsp05_42470 [Actinokineospora sp. NBRC 105648]
MRFSAATRPDGAFQEPVTAEQVTAMCVRAFGAAPVVVEELTGGLYNNTYRVDTGAAAPVILRVAPRAGGQFRVERALMRNEHAALPHFAPIAAMMPRTLFADWTHDLIDRDYTWQTALDGVPAAEGIKRYPRGEWTPFYRQLGAIARRVHDVRGHRFGPVAGPTFDTWSAAVLAAFDDIAADLHDVGLDNRDVAEVTATARRGAEVLDEVTRPHLLHGDLWTPNVMLADGAPEPTITGVLDHDRASWGDPAADWPIFVLTQRPPEARVAFRETYGPDTSTPGGRWRALIYRARHIATARLERHRIGATDRLPASYADMEAVLRDLAVAEQSD